MGNKSTKNAGPVKSARPGKITYVTGVDEPIVFVDPSQLAPKSHKGLKIAGITLAMMAVACGCAYGGAAYYYSNRFFNGTTINGINASGKTAYEMEQLIASKIADYSITVNARNTEDQTILGSDINYQYASGGQVLSILKQQNPLRWVEGYVKRTDYSIPTKATFDKKLLEQQVKSLACAQEENQVAAENAYVAYNGSSFEIVPETEGSELIIKQAYLAVDEAIASDSSDIDLGSTPNVYEDAEITSDDPALQDTVQAYNNLANASITYTFGDTSVVLDGGTFQSWLAFDDKGRLMQDDASFQQKAAEYVASLAAQYDTVGTERPFNTTNGRTVYVYGSAYGWQIDQAAETAQLMEDIKNGSQVTREPIYSMTANSHGYNDFGDTYIEVDLSDQHMYYYQNGSIIFDSEIVSGLMSDPSRQTPSGVYTLYYKKSPDVLRGSRNAEGEYEYETPVQYWMPFNGGVGFHDASWQPYFGGDRFLEGGSHGCINLPPEAAGILYSIIQYGVPIICFY